MQHKRVLLKLSGEALIDDKFGAFSPKRIQSYISDIQHAIEKGVQVVIVLGGGNIIRGAKFDVPFVHSATADQMAMLGIMINGLIIRDAFLAADLPVSLYSAHAVDGMMAAFDRIQANQDLNDGKVVICVGGTGNPFVTTDSGASLRAIELDCEVILKATKVDGVYNADPKKEVNAVMYETLTFDEALQQELKVMDLTAFSQCRDYDIAIQVFNVFKPGALKRALLGESEGTLVSNH